jgi:hypothetical protein
MRLTFALPLFLAVAASAATNLPPNVPSGRAPMVDNNNSPEEWRGSSKVDLPGGAQLWVLQNDDYIFLCVRAPRPVVFGVDLYIADAGGRVINLQAAAQLGERTAVEGKWPEMTWWNNLGWTATIVPYVLNKEGRPEFRATAAKEFQLNKLRFKEKSYRIRLTYQFGREGPAQTFPVGALAADPVNWYTLNL